jgi:hypothetical protein
VVLYININGSTDVKMEDNEVVSVVSVTQSTDLVSNKRKEADEVDLFSVPGNIWIDMDINTQPPKKQKKLPIPGEF